MMRIYASDVGNCDYLTKHKRYQLLKPDLGSDGEVYGGIIIDDSGEKLFVCIKMSSHIYDKDWNIIND